MSQEEHPEEATTDRALLRLLPILSLFGLVYLFASPFRFGEKGSGRYLLTVLKKLDPALFPGDEAVQAIGHFGSLFYRVAGSTLAALGATPEAFATIWQGLYLAARLGLLIALFYLGRKLGGVALAVVLATWGAHIKPTFVGGTALFVPLLSHHQIAVLGCVLALGWLVDREALSGGEAAILGTFLGIALLVHPLVVGYFVLVFFPAWWLFQKRRREIPWLAILGLLTGGVLYLQMLSPPAMTVEESAAFLATKAQTEHVSLFAQPDYGWLKFVLLLSLACVSRSLWLKRFPSALQLQGAALLGGVAALTLAILAQASESVLLTRVQPLRALLWVQFFAELLLLWSAVVAWREKHRQAPWLCAVLAFHALDSIWFLAFAALGLLWVTAQIEQTVWKLRRLEAIAAAFLLMAIPLFLLLGDRQPLASAREWTGFWVALAVAGCFLGRQGTERGRLWTGVLLLVAILATCSWRDHRDFAAHRDPAWQEVGRWVWQNTPKEASFLTRPGLPYFRLVSRRTSQTEAMSALYWVDPSALETTQGTIERFRACRFESGLLSLDCLFALAHETDSSYLLLNEPVLGAVAPIFELKPYRVYRVPEPTERFTDS